MASMKRSNISAGYLAYIQGKTEKKTILTIGGELSSIFSRYMKEGRSCIFPLFEDGEVINERTVNSRLTYINKYIKEVCKYAGILKKITSHCSRHTFIDLALTASGENIYQVKDIVGHGRNTW